jgi:GAF domain-containing protein
VLSSVRRRSHVSQRAGAVSGDYDAVSSVLDSVRSLTRSERDTLQGWAVQDAERASRLGDHDRRSGFGSSAASSGGGSSRPRPRSGAPRSSTARRLGKLDTWLGHVLSGVTRRGTPGGAGIPVAPPRARAKFDADAAEHPELLARIEALERENDRLLSQVADMSDAQARAQDRADKEAASLKGQVKSLEQSLASAQEQLREMQLQQDSQTGVQVSDGTAITSEDDQLAAVTAVLNDDIDRVEFFDLLDHIPTSVKNDWLLTMSLQLRTLGKLISLNDAINDNLSKMETAMGKITEEACEVLDAERSTVFAIDYAKRELYSIITGGDGNIEIRLPDNTGIVGHVYQTNELLNIHDAYDDPRFNREVDKRSGLRTKAILCAPIWAHAGLKIGLLQTINKRGGGIFDRDDEAKIQALALKVGIHLYHAAVYEDATRFMRSRPVLHTIMTSFLNELDLGVEMDSIVEEICDKLGAERASVFLADFSSQELFSTSAKNTDFQIRIPWNAGIAGLCFSSGETINIPDAYNDDRFNQAVDKRTGFKTTQILCMPMRNADDVVVGIVQAINRLDEPVDPFDHEDEYYLNRISIQASFTLSYASSFARALSK